MTDIILKVTLKKGEEGIVIDNGLLPIDGVIYYDGETAPEGYEATTQPS